MNVLRSRIALLIVFLLASGAFFLYVSTYGLPRPRTTPGPAAQKVRVPSDAPLEVNWARRWGRDGAPALSMLVPAAQSGRWLAGEHPEPGRLVERTVSPGGPDRLHLEGFLPDAEALSAKALGAWCPSGPQARDCNAATLHISLLRGIPDMNETVMLGYAVLSDEEPGQRPEDGSAAAPYRKLTAFWVKEAGSTGRLEFVGWDCPGEDPTGPASTDLSRPLLERDRCFAPTNRLVRFWPSLFGYERLKQLAACQGREGACRLYFSFRGRIAEVDLHQTAISAEAESALRHAFFGAWQLLNQIYGDTRFPPLPEIRLARASVARENCRAASAMRPADGGMSDELRSLLRAQCEYAIQLALLVLRERPVDVAGVIADVFEAHSGGWPSSYAQAAVDALAKGGQSETRAMAVAQYTLGSAIHFNTFNDAERSSDKARAKRAALQEAARLADAVLEPGSEQYSRIYRELFQTLHPEKEADEKIALMERWLERVRKARGPTDGALREPLYHLCFAMRETRKVRLKECADELRPLWLASLDKEGRTSSRETVAYGFSMMSWYASFALSQNKPEEVLPSMLTLAAILESQVGRNEWVLSPGPSELSMVEQRLRELRAKPASASEAIRTVRAEKKTMSRNPAVAPAFYARWRSVRTRVFRADGTVAEESTGAQCVRQVVDDRMSSECFASGNRTGGARTVSKILALTPSSYELEVVESVTNPQFVGRRSRVEYRIADGRLSTTLYPLQQVPDRTGAAVVRVEATYVRD